MSPLKPVQTSYPLKLRPEERRVLLLFGDIIMQALALLVALYDWANADAYLDFSIEFLRQTPVWFYLLPIFFLLLIGGLYDQYRASNQGQTLRWIAFAALISFVLYLTIYFFFPPGALPRRGVAVYVVSALILTLLWRLTYIRIFTAPQFLRRVLLVGAGETGQILLRIIRELYPQPFLLVGIIDDDPVKIGKIFEGYPVLGDNSRLIEIICEKGITDLIVAISGKMQGSMFQALLDAQESGIEITRMPVAYEELLGRVPIRYLEADWILRSFVDQARANVYYETFKRLIDLLGGSLALLIVSPLIPFICLGILLDSGAPIFYKQIRLGRGAHPYNILKFRTMVQNAEPDGKARWAEVNDQRATRIGAVLRKTHFDEIPQFLNVLRGEMSLVGPRAERPELVEYFQGQVPFYRARLLVKPGITGWAQINQEYASTVEETIVKLEYDLFYIKSRSIWMDIKVILRTPSMVLGLRGR